MIFSCTKKVRDKIKKYKPILNTKEEISFFNWYVDSIIVERKKHFLFTNSKTLYSFFFYVGTKKEIENIEVLFEEKLIKSIQNDFQIDIDVLKGIFKENRSYSYHKTNSRSVLGSMNDMKNHLQYHFDDDYGINDYKAEHNYYLNEMYMGALKYEKPKNIMKEEILSMV